MAKEATRNDWVVTIPKKTSWDVYEEEARDVEDRNKVLNFRSPYFPREMKIGERCYVLWNGRVRGWMEIVGLLKRSTPWTCETTGTFWPAGKYIQRSGPFHAIDGPEMKSFRGVRRFDRRSIECDNESCFEGFDYQTQEDCVCCRARS